MQSYTIKNTWLWLICFLWLAGASCERTVKAPDVSHIPMTVKIQRFDQELFRIDSNAVGDGLKQLSIRYPLFLPVYSEHIVNLGHYSDSSDVVAHQLRTMLTNRDLRLLQDSVNKHFATVEPIEQALTQAFKYTKYYLPDFHAPEVITFISAIGNYGAITADGVLGIGLDMYMGEDFGVYGMLPDYPAYMVRKFSPAYIPANCMLALVQQRYPLAANNTTLIAQIVDAGRQQYFLDKVLPSTPDTIKTGYTKEQLAWCNDNEQLIWQFFVQQQLLYNSDWQNVSRFLSDAPTTQGMPGEAPGKIGYFVGWQIVKKYMDRNPQMTLQQLLEIKDPMLIFNGSKYKPR